MPMHFFSILQTLKLFLEIISAGSFFLWNIWRENVLLAQKQKVCKSFWLLDVFKQKADVSSGYTPSEATLPTRVRSTI